MSNLETGEGITVMLASSTLLRKYMHMYEEINRTLLYKIARFANLMNVI